MELNIKFIYYYSIGKFMFMLLLYVIYFGYCLMFCDIGKGTLK